jgi:hypothetical protein
MRGFSRNVLIVTLCVLAGGVAWGQGTAELTGRVTDGSGAVLPGVTVTVTQTNTGFTRTTWRIRRRRNTSPAWTWCPKKGRRIIAV